MDWAEIEAAGGHAASGKNDFPQDMNRIEARVMNTVYMGNIVDIFMRAGEHTFRAMLPKEPLLSENAIAYFGVPFSKTHVLRG